MMMTDLDILAPLGETLVPQTIQAGPVVAVRPLPNRCEALPKPLREAFIPAIKHLEPVHVVTCLIMGDNRIKNGPTEEYFLVPASAGVRPSQMMTL